MPATIFPHQDFESLLAALPAPGTPGGPVLRPVVVPSLTFGDYVQGRIADRFGICMGLEFLMPQEFVHRAVGPGRNSPWSKRRLVWRVLPHVAEYSGQLGVGDPSPRDRFALAGLLADRIDQYGHFRPELIRRWAVGKWGKEKPAEHEGWQRDLWRKLRDEISDPHPALAMAQLQGSPDARKALAARYPELLVLGTGAIDPLLVEVLQLLSGEGTDVSVHVVLPSLEYLGDLRRRGQHLDEGVDPEDIAMPGGHPLLESMGRHAIGAFHLLGKLDDQYTFWPEAGNQTGDWSSLLRRVQSDIRSLRQPAKEAGDTDGPSLKVHSCFGPRREMEVLRDELLRAFDELENLKPDEVHIVTPDPETYAPLVSAVLRQGNAPLPVRLSEIPPSGVDPMVEGMVALLGMAHSGRFEAAEVLDLAEKPAVLAALNTGDAAMLRRWIRDSGLTHGAGDAGPGTSTFSRNRLMAGRWFGQDSPARYPDGTFVLPVADQLGGDLELGEHFFGWLASLEATMDTWKNPASAKAWSERLGKAAQDFLRNGADAISAVVEPQIFRGNLGNVAIAKKTGLPVLFKDFVISEAQIEAAARTGADAMLIVARACGRLGLDTDNMISMAHSLGLEVLLECYDGKEMEAALETDADMLGINNRDLQTLKVDLGRTKSIVERFGKLEKPLISESGVRNRADVEFLMGCGVKGVLVGTAIWKASDIGEKIRELKGV